MFSTRSRQLAWLLVLAVVSATGAMSLAQQRRYSESQAAVHAAMAARQVVSDTLSLLKDAETGQRGYLLTNDEAFLGPYEQARQQLPLQLGSLVRLVQHDEQQLTGARQLERLSREKLDELAATIATSRRNPTEALALVREGRGRRLMLALREESQRMLERQTEQLREREFSTDEGRVRLTVLLAGSSCVFLCCALWGVWSAARGVAESRRANERLRENQATLRLVTDNATDLVRIVGPDSQLTYVSPSCEAMLQYSQAEMFAMSPLSLMHPDERDATRQLALEVLRGEPAHGPLVHRLRSKDGSYRWFETTYCRVQSGDTDAAHIHLTSRDITARKEAEDALRRQTARLHSVLSSIGDGVVVLDPDRRLAIVNPAAKEYISREEGETVTDQGPLTLALSGESSAGTEVVIRDRRGTMRTFSVSASPIREGEAMAGGVAVYHDITQQRMAEKDLQESEQRMRVLAEATFEGVAISKAGVVIDTNETLAAWLGCAPFELVGVDGLSLFAPEDHALAAEKSTQTGEKYEAHMLRRNGERFPVEVRGRHASFRGQTVRIAVIRDITERRQRETELHRQAELLRTMSLRDELTGLLNRRGFQEHARQQLRLALRTKRPAVVFFIDLNGMKVINDTFGHDAGDAALSETAQVLTSAFRESDIVARLGGDEFAIFAADCDARGAAAMHARIDKNVEASNQAARTYAFRLSVSVGTASFEPSAPRELEALLEAADQAMYEQKRARADSGTLARVQASSGARQLG